MFTDTWQPESHFRHLKNSTESVRRLFRRIIPEVCDAIWQSLKRDFMKKPDSPDAWREVASDFERQWQFPRCVGVIDGKHIRIKAPRKSGSLYFSKYKGFFSIVLMACVDSNMRFIFIDVGGFGSNNDAGIFDHSTFGTCIKRNTIGLPNEEVITGAKQYGNVPVHFRRG